MVEIPNKSARGPLRTVDLQDVIEQAVALLGDVSRIWLFGSRMHQTGSVRSDIDVLVERSSSAPISLAQVATLRRIEPYIDWFSATGGVATSIANGSYVAAGSLDQLVEMLDAKLIWARGTNDFGVSVSMEHDVLTNSNPAMTQFEMTGLPDPYETRYVGLVVAALRAEFESLLDVFPRVTTHGPTEAESIVTNKDGRDVRIYLTCVDRMGPVETASAVTATLQEITPAWVILCGIAGGLQSKASLGDVLVPEAIYDYEVGKVSRDPVGGPARFEASPAFYQVSTLLHQHASALASTFVPSVATRRLFPQPAAVTIHTDGIVASGAKVIADAERAVEVASLHRKVHGIEMEGVGVAVASRRMRVEEGFLVIKSVSDLADADKADGWHRSCSTLSAEFALAVIEDL